MERFCELLGCWAGGLGNTVPSPHMEKTPQIRHWCFTSYVDRWPTWVPDKMVYLIYQVEVCPESGRGHIQGYVEFNRSYRMNAAKKLIGDLTAHLEPRQGSRSQARDYCRKEESRAPGEHAGPWEYGEWKEGEAKRSELESAITHIKEGKDWQFVVSENPGVAIRYYKNLNQVWHHFNSNKRDGQQPTYNVYIFGDAGVGKTRFAHWLCNRHGVIPYTGYIRGWWQDYLGEAWAIYDDFDGGAHMDPGHFKKICDRYPTVVATKGGSAQYSASVNIFTSNICPIDWYPREHWDAVKRRAYHSVWWRSSSIRCDTCEDAGRESCEIIDLIHEAQVEWDHEP